jgi:hypothetical protein
MNVNKNRKIVTLVLLMILVASLQVDCRKKDSTGQTPEDVKITSGSDYSLVLGRPSGNSMTMNLLFAKAAVLYIEYGESTGIYTSKSLVATAEAGKPSETALSNLKGNSAYFYRVRYHFSESSEFLAGPEYSFRTSRTSGSSFTFAIEADPHLDTNSDTLSYKLTLQNILSKKPDFLLDLGDTFMSEKQATKTMEVIKGRHLLLRSYFDDITHSVPLYLVLGNHEGETGWELDGTANNLAVMASNTRNLYFPNPSPDGYYTGNTKSEPYVGLRKNYYSFEWGDAQVIVLDPYWYTTSKVGWNWTLGSDQYNWFKNALVNSKAKYKFVFCHNLVGGNGNDARGGAEFVDLFEMGGYNLDGSYGFDKYRPGWGKSLHTLMKENKVTVFFHGHDHFYGKQDKDGIVYQEVPQPSNRNITNISAKDYGYVSGTLLPGRGYLLVTVSNSAAKVEYIKTLLPAEEGPNGKNGDIAASYTIN